MQTLRAFQQASAPSYAPYVKSTPPLNPHYFIKKMVLKNISSVITVVMFTCYCMFHLSVLVSIGSQKCSLV